MLSVEIEIPKPSPKVSHDVVETISTAYNRAFREKSPAHKGKLLDVDRLVDFLEISMLEEERDEPDDAKILASAQNELDRGVMIVVNKRYRDLFKERPDVYAAVIGQEIGHIVLGHLDVLAQPSQQTSLLFDDKQKSSPRLHKNTWGWYGLTKKEIDNLKAREREAIATLL